MSEIGKSLIFFGVLLIAAGAAVLASGKISWLGRLPGDIRIEKENFAFYFPLATSLAVSAAISLIFWLLSKFK